MESYKIRPLISGFGYNGEDDELFEVNFRTTAGDEIQVYVLLATNLLLLLAVVRRAKRSHVALGLTQSDIYKGIWLRKLSDALFT